MRSWMPASIAIPAVDPRVAVPTASSVKTSRSTSGTGLGVADDRDVDDRAQHAASSSRSPEYTVSTATPARLAIAATVVPAQPDSSNSVGRGGEHLGPGLPGLARRAGRGVAAAGAGASDFFVAMGCILEHHLIQYSLFQ